MIELILKIPAQKLFVYESKKLIKTYFVSTSRHGVGGKINSYKTPCGLHEIYAKIGNGCPVNTVFVARKPTGEFFSAELAQQRPERKDHNWILTRILQLKGLELGKNLHGDVDTLERYVYIHGTPDSVKMGIPQSEGCILMRNADVIELFDLVSVGTRLYIYRRHE